MRYIILILLNVPVVLLALLSFITKYKMRKITKKRFKTQIFIWSAILLVLVGSFPVYNYMVGRPLLDSHELSLFDIAQTTVMILLLYIVNTLRQKIQRTEKMLRDLHQNLSLERRD
jgi:hypothetical protein